MKSKIVFYLVILFCGTIVAQKTEYFQDPERKLKDGIEMYHKQKYATAQTFFIDYLEQVRNKGNMQAPQYALADANYYYAVCAVDLFQEDAQYLVEKFIAEYPESPKVGLANFYLGKIYFRNKDWDKAINQLNKTDQSQLTKEQVFEYNYKMGYSHFMQNDFNSAELYFKQVKDIKNLYQVPAIYYYAHIKYVKGNYNEALENFLKIKDDKKFGGVVTFYIAQIYFLQKKYQEAVDFASPIIDTLKGKNTHIVRRILAESYYELKNYDKAIYHFEKYIESGNSLDRSGSYKLGLVYYGDKQYDKAANHLKDAASEKDSLSQSAYYYLADCLIKTNNKKLAVEALKFSYLYDFDAKITKEAMLNFARLSYELGDNPYNEAIDALLLYTSKYPNDKNADEAYEILANAYLATRNYKDAISTIDKVKVKSTSLKLAEQKIYLYRGMELFNNQDYDDALTHFAKAIEKNQDGKITSLAKFWTGDAYFRQKKFSSSATYFSDFINSSSSRVLPEFSDGYYNLGYSYFQQKNYNSALNEFVSFIQKAPVSDYKISDANVRIADCYFMAKNLTKAIEFYDKSIKGSQPSNDYALYQKANILGYQGNNTEKANTLLSAINNYPNSTYKEKMLYDLGNTYNRLGRKNEAAETFERLIREKPGSAFQAKAYNELGYLNHEKKLNREALGWYKKTVAEYPNTFEANKALTYIRNIYVEMGDIDGYTSYVGSLGGSVNVSTTELDSTAWESAENSLISGDCNKTIDVMTKYLNNFPNGLFSLEAHHRKSDCLYSQKKYNESKPGFEFIISKPNSEYTENALNKVAYVYELAKDSVNLERVYEMLERTAKTPQSLSKATIGLMRTKYKLRKYNETISYAQKVKTLSGAEPYVVQQANFLIGKSYYELGDYDNALTNFKYFTTRTSSEFYPEATYHIGLIHYNNENYNEAEKVLTKGVKYMGGQKDWLARSFILLSDVFVAKNNLLEAKGVLQAVIDNHDGEELRNLAQQKLNAITEMENSKNRSTNDSNEMEPNNNNPNGTNNVPN